MGNLDDVQLRSRWQEQGVQMGAAGQKVQLQENENTKPLSEFQDILRGSGYFMKQHRMT
jgi:hypothetical protein